MMYILAFPVSTDMPLSFWLRLYGYWSLAIVVILGWWVVGRVTRDD